MHQAIAFEHKPLLRGWLHAMAAVGAVILTLILGFTNHSDFPRLIALLIFGISMIMLYTVSAVFHIGRWRGRWLRLLWTFDHANIFIFIAATYTPICYTILPGWERVALLIVIWVLALAGVGLTIFAPRFPRPLKTGLYIGMGWVAIFVLPVAIEVLSWLPIGLLFFSGMLYTIGAIIFALRRPNPFPRFFGYHEIFHVLVVLASIINSGVIIVWIVPFPRA
jgi:hemolysin III